MRQAMKYLASALSLVMMLLPTSITLEEEACTANGQVQQLQAQIKKLQSQVQALQSQLPNYPEVKFLNVKQRKRILVTGGSGFVGSHLVDELMLAGHEVVVADNFFTGRY